MIKNRKLLSLAEHFCFTVKLSRGASKVALCHCMQKEKVIVRLISIVPLIF